MGEGRGMNKNSINPLRWCSTPMCDSDWMSHMLHYVLPSTLLCRMTHLAVRGALSVRCTCARACVCHTWLCDCAFRMRYGYTRLTGDPHSTSLSDPRARWNQVSSHDTNRGHHITHTHTDRASERQIESDREVERKWGSQIKMWRGSSALLGLVWALGL